MAAPHAENPKTPSEGSCLPRVFTLGGMLMLIVEKAGGRDRHIIDGREAECVERPRLGCGGVDRLQHREKNIGQRQRPEEDALIGRTHRHHGERAQTVARRAQA
jgi:hypothetical protein